MLVLRAVVSIDMSLLLAQAQIEYRDRQQLSNPWRGSSQSSTMIKMVLQVGIHIYPIPTHVPRLIATPYNVRHQVHTQNTRYIF